MQTVDKVSAAIDTEAIGARIKRVRKAQHMSQDELAEAAGVTQGTISRIELGRHGAIELESVVRIAHALKILTSELLGECDQPIDAKIRQVTELMQNMPEYKKDVAVATAKTLARPDNTPQ